MGSKEALAEMSKLLSFDPGKANNIFFYKDKPRTFRIQDSVFRVALNPVNIPDGIEFKETCAKYSVVCLAPCGEKNTWGWTDIEPKLKDFIGWSLEEWEHYTPGEWVWMVVVNVPIDWVYLMINPTPDKTPYTED